MVVHTEKSFCKLILVEMTCGFQWPFNYLVDNHGLVVATGTIEELKVWCDMNCIEVEVKDI